MYTPKHDARGPVSTQPVITTSCPLIMLLGCSRPYNTERTENVLVLWGGQQAPPLSRKTGSTSRSRLWRWSNQEDIKKNEEKEDGSINSHCCSRSDWTSKSGASTESDSSTKLKSSVTYLVCSQHLAAVESCMHSNYNLHRLSRESATAFVC